MPRKVFKVTVELEVQAVTCPGVWLCPKGSVSLHICMLGASAKSKHLQPSFPLLFHDHFRFTKSFVGIRYLTDLQARLGRQLLSVEMIQWAASGPLGTLLASFQTSIEELLYPSPECHDRLEAGVDVDLLMEPTKCFPGILAPKVEVSTRTTIEEVVNSSTGIDSEASVAVVNHKLLSSKKPAPQTRRQRRVCHGRSQRSHVQPRLRRRRTQPQAAAVCSQCCANRSTDHATSAWQSTGNKLDVRCHDTRPHVAARRRDLSVAHRSEERTPSFNEAECPICLDYKRVFETCTTCRYPIVETQDNPRGCLCLTPSLRSSSTDQSEPTIARERCRGTEEPHSCCRLRLQPGSSERCCQLKNKKSSREVFYRNLEKFYRKLSEQSKCRDSPSSCPC